MKSNLTDTTTVRLNFWSVFTDIVSAMLLILVFFIFVQFIANSRALVRLLVEERQEKMKALLFEELGLDSTYLSVVSDGNLQRLRFSNAILFDEASAVLKPDGRRVLASLANALYKARSYYGEILIEGHTDERNIRDEYRHVFPSNWELSSARATSVVRFFEDYTKITPGLFRLSSVGKSQYAPVDMTFDRSRASRRSLEDYWYQNRRIEVVLVYSEKGLFQW